MKTKIIKLIGKCIKKDRDHHVIITEDYVAGYTSLPNYLCDDFKIEDGKITVFATGDREPVIDGATCAPDKIGDLDIAPGYILHDLFYAHLEDISAKWRTDVKNVRKVADDILENAIAQQKCAGSKLVSKIYYAAVRCFGGIAHALGKLFTIALILFIFTGCAAQVITLEEDPPYQVILNK